jgi:hypothetical protein
VDDDVNSAFADEEEDLMLKEKREEQVRLRQQGLRQKKVEAERKLEEERSVSALCASSFIIAMTTNAASITFVYC